MSADSHSFDPYQSPSLPEGPYMGPPPNGRPGWLTTLCVLCIVLGALGLVNSAFGTIGMIVGRKFQQMVAAQPRTGMPADLQDAQQKMQEEMYAIQTKYIVPLGLSIVVRVVVCTILVVGGIRTLGMSEPGRKWLLTGCALALVFEALNAILQSMMAMENMSVMHGFVETMVGKDPGEQEKVERVMKTVMVFAQFFSIALIGLFAFAKMGLYFFGLIYLRKPHIVALCQSNQSLTPAISDF